MLASRPANARALETFLINGCLPVVGTFQAAGAVGAQLFDNFGGRVGQLANQPADRLLDSADLVITIGYDPVEYWPAEWNAGKDREIIHIDVLPADLDNSYQPDVELTGDIAQTLDALAPRIRRIEKSALSANMLAAIIAERAHLGEEAAKRGGTPIHPLRLVHELKALVSPDTTVCLDMGSFHLWIARHLYSFRARQVLITNGQQTLGVALLGQSPLRSFGPRKKSSPSREMAGSSFPRWSSRPPCGSTSISCISSGSTGPTTWLERRKN